MIGTLVNAASIVAGGVVGSLIGFSVPDRMRETVLNAVGLAVLLVGLEMALETRNALIVVGSVAAGGFVGELLGIEAWLERIGRALEKRVGAGRGDFAAGFVRATLVYCVGAMAIIGPIEDGMLGQPQTLFAKSILDGVSAAIFAAGMGVGVAFSALSVLVYQGAITLFASLISRFFTPVMMQELSATGGLLILAIGLNILNITKIRVGNLLPGIFIAATLVRVLGV